MYLQNLKKRLSCHFWNKTRMLRPGQTTKHHQTLFGDQCWHADFEVSGQTAKKCFIKHRSNNWYKPLSKRGTHARIKHWLIRGCPNEQNIAHQTREQTKCLKFLIECLMAFKFNQTRSNTWSLDQTRSKRSNSTEQGVKMFSHQTMFDVVWSPNISRLCRALTCLCWSEWPNG